MASISKTKFASYSPAGLCDLYEKDHELFDKLADEAIKQACVGKTPDETIKLQQLQWSIDMHLRKGKTPRERMQIMESIFYGQVFGDDGKLAKLRSCCTELVRAINGTGPEASKKPKLRLVGK